jgi:hemolysin III
LNTAGFSKNQLSLCENKIYNFSMDTTPPIKPLLRGHFHQAMFFVSLGATIMLLLMTETSKEFWSILIYSIGLLSMLGISAIYHRIQWYPQSRALWRKLDHSGIYIMIAGTFTPVSLLALSDESGIRLLTIIWVIAFFGILQSFFFVTIPKIFSSILYLIAGYMVIPYLGELSAKLSTVAMIMLIAGGVTYSLGALAYAFKWPNLSPRIFGYHEVFHVLVSIAAIMHFALVYSLVQH